MKRKTTYENQKDYLKYMYLFIKTIHYLELDKEHELLLKKVNRMGVQTTHHSARNDEFLIKKRMICNKLNKYYKDINFNTDFYKAAASAIDSYKADIFDSIYNGECDINWTIDSIKITFRGREILLDDVSAELLNDRSILGGLTNKPIDFLLAGIVSRKTARQNFDNCMELLKQITFSGNNAVELLEQDDINIAQLLIMPNNIEADYKTKDHLLLDKMMVLNRIIMLDHKERLHLNKNKGVVGTIINRLRYYEGDQIDLTLVSMIRNVFERDKYSMLDINNGVDFISILESIRDKNQTIDDILKMMATKKNFEKQVKNSRDYESLKKHAEPYAAFLKRNKVDVDINYIYKLKKGSF